MVIDLSSVLANRIPEIEIYMSSVLQQQFNDLYLKYDVNDKRSRVIESAAATARVSVTMEGGSISFSVNVMGAQDLLNDVPWIDAGEIQADIDSCVRNFETIGNTVAYDYIQNELELDATQKEIAKQIEPEIAKMIQSSLGGT